MIYNLLSTTPAPAAAPTPGPSILMSLVSLGLVFVVFYLFLIRPQNKRDKEQQKMRQSIEVGNDVVTIGGIIGTVVSIKDDTIVIETSGDRNKIRIQRWAIQQNTTPKE